MPHRTPAAIGLALAALAMPTAAAAPGATAAAWTVAKAASSLRFEGVAQDEAFSGSFGKWDATIHFDPANLGASQAIVTIDTASGGTGDPDKDGPLKDENWLATAMFPTATFKSDTISSTGPGAYVAEGTLTIRGVSQPVSLPFTLAIDGDNAKMQGSVTLDRNLFKIGAGAWQDHSVDPSVTVKVDLVAKRAG